MHPILNALFNKETSDPSKQLVSARELLCRGTPASPQFLLILPPAALLARDIDLQWLYHDAFLLSHVADVSNMHESQVFDVLNGSQGQVSITNTQVSPIKGFPANSASVKILSSYVWSPGVSWLPYNATFLVVDVDGLLVGRAPQKMGWFGTSRSTPYASRGIGTGHEPPRDANVRTEPDAGSPQPSYIPLRNKRRNPASELGRTKAQRDQNMAKVDYSLACLQQDVVTSRELAERFHKAVTAVRSTLIEAGGSYVDTVELDASGDPISESDFSASRPELLLATSFTLSSVYEYAEARLGSHLLRQLEILLQAESKQPSFLELYKDLRNLDIRQVDIPNLSSLDETAFERAVSEAALILGRLSNARGSAEMCQVFLSSLKALANPALGTVSADTLLGLFMLTVLRTSEDAAAVLERDLYFVTHFSFQASDTVATRANAGRLSYTLMVVESVLLQLRVEHPRLKKLAKHNVDMWAAVRGDDRESMKKIGEESESSLVSRRSGKSALFMAAEDHNAELVKFLFKTFPNAFNKEFALKDRDINNRTLLMAAAADELTASTILDIVGDVDSFYQARDLSGRTVAFYLKPSKFADRIADKLDWTTRDAGLDTPVLYHVKVHYRQGLPTLIKYCDNVLQHIDADGNSLLHFAAKHDDLELARHLLALPSCVVDWANRMGETALMHAASEPFASLLLEHGADPWFGERSALFSPVLRAARVGNSPAVGPAASPAPYVEAEGTQLHVFEAADSDSGVTKSALDFATLSSELQALGPTSWVPPLQYTYVERLGGTKLGSRFLFQLSELEMQRLTFWLRQLAEHATFGSVPILKAFFEPDESADENANSSVSRTNSEAENVKSGSSARSDTLFPLFGRESVDSMLAFLKLGTEQLKSIQHALEEFVRHFARVRDLQFTESKLATHLDTNLERLALTTGYKLSVAHSTTPRSLSSQVMVATLDKLAQFAGDLGSRLQTPYELSAKLEATRAKLEEDREKLRSLAEGKPKPAWLGNLEQKRNAEMKNLEAAIIDSRHALGNLEAEMRATHYSLANELSGFNKSQEEEILRQIRSYSKLELSKARDSLRKVQFGYKEDGKA